MTHPSFVLVLFYYHFSYHGHKNKEHPQPFLEKRTQFKFILYHFYSILIKNVKCQTNDKNEKEEEKGKQQQQQQ